MKRTIAVMIVFIMMMTFMPIVLHAEESVSVWDGVSVSSDWGSDYSTSSTFDINSAADFMALRNKVVIDKSTFLSKTINLNCDIDLNNYNLRYGIGYLSSQTWSRATFFRGTFNGNGHIIRNIVMDQTKPDGLLGTSDANGAVGLFTVRSANISKLGVENISIVLPGGITSNCYYGGLASIGYVSPISDCYVKNISFSGGSSDGTGVTLGGIAGWLRGESMKNTYIDGCDFSGLADELIKNSFAGGIACSGDANTTVEKSYSANIKKHSSGQGGYDNAVFILNSQKNGIDFTVTLNNVYTDISSHQSDGTAGNTGLLSSVADDLNGTLGNAFKDMSKFGMNPILAWEPSPTRTVTFVGDYEGSVEVALKQDAVLPAPPTGYHYIYEADGAQWTGKGITEDVVVTVTKVINTYTISYTGDYTGEDTVEHGKDAVLPKDADPSVLYKFSVNDSPWDGKNITADVEVTVTKAADPCVVTFTGDYTGSQTYEKGSDVSFPAAETGYHYIFTVAGMEWDGKNITGDTVVTVTKEINKYTVYYTGDYTGTKTVEHGKNAEFPIPPDGYEYLFFEGSKPWEGKNITESVNVNVRFAHSVKYIGDYNQTVIILHGEDAEKPAAPEGSRFEFSCNSEKWTGKNIISNVTVTVTKITDTTADESEYSVWDGVSVTSGWAGDYEATSVFEINSAADFMAFRNMVITGEYTFSSKTVNLNCDIDFNNFNLRYGVGVWTDLSSNEWWKVAYLFYGVFNGNKHIIKNLTMDQTKPDALLGTSDENGAVGLFAARKASISELGLEDVTVVLANSSGVKPYYAGLASFGYLTTISDCYVKDIKFKGGWKEAISATIGGISSYQREGTMKSVYIKDCDFSGLDSSFIGNANIGAIACSGDGDTTIEKCYSSNIIKHSSTQNGYDNAVFVLNSDKNGSSFTIRLNNIYTDNQVHQGKGNIGNTGLLSEALSDVQGCLGNGFTDLSEYSLPPILIWEKMADPFTYKSISIYKSYGTQDQKKTDYLDSKNGKLTVVIKNLANNTGNDLKNAVVSAAYINNKKAEVIRSSFISIPKMSEQEEITLEIDLSGITVDNNGFLQITVYKGADIVVPIIKSKKITR